MYKIVVPTDFSKLSEHALDVALDIARRANGAVFLLNVIGDMKNYSFSSMGGGVTDEYVSEDDRYVLELHRSNEKKLKNLIAKHQHGDVPVYPFIEIDDLDEGVNHFAERLNCDLVVMGTSGENTITEYFEGNHTERVIRITHIPVLTIRNPIANLSIKNIVFATDLKTVAKEGVDQIEKFATFYGATVHMVHVSNDNTEKVRKRMEAFAEEHETPHQVPELTINPIRGAKVEQAILEFASQKNADIVASVNHGRKGLMHLFVGGLSERLVRDSEVPVLTVHMDPH
jgi:nucleotide-binding universal stress UspA family protein